MKNYSLIQCGINGWNVKTIVTFSDNAKDEWKSYNSSSKKPDINSLVYLPIELAKFYEDGFGYKVLASSLDGASYTKIRQLITKIPTIKKRTGLNVCTNKTKELRSERAKIDNPWKHIEIRDKNQYSHGIQGYFINKANKKLWLRSTWEYIFVKWLDKHNKKYEYEHKQYKLSDGSSYRPDFLVEENGSFYIIDVKGYKLNNLYKTKLLEKEFNIKVVVIDDIKPYCEKPYCSELIEWKKSRILNEN